MPTETREAAGTDPAIQAALDRCMVSLVTLDVLTARHTCCADFAELIGLEGSYRLTARRDEHAEPGIRAERIALANAYDVAREARRDDCRTQRG